MNPKFKSTQDGVVIIDPIERKQYRIETNTPVAPTPVATDRIPYPIDTTVEITTDGFRVLSDNSIYVRDSTGSLLTEVQANERSDLPHAEYVLDISGPLKVYATVESAIHVDAGVGRAEIAFAEPTSTIFGARSYHTSPMGTITTTTEPTDMMQAVSMFGSALKTTSPERSYPTLRGHPPAIELADELDVPETLCRPETGIRIEIPPTLEHILVVAPLAYYLAAAVVPGSTPQLATETGYTYSLEGEAGFERTVDQTLKQFFLLDCIVRTEGETPLPLYERQAIEPALEFDIAHLYDRPIAEQLETYLEVPFETVQSQLPDWQFETRLEARPDSLEILPFLTNYLPTITVATDARPLARTPQAGIRTTDTDPESALPLTQQVWGDEEIEITGTGTLPAFRNGITQSPRDDPLEIDVVCNDPDMGTEFATVHSAYRDRNDLPLEVTVHFDLTTAELEDVFARESDFVHYIGHIDADGFRCSDGTLDATDIETVGTKAFVLNACRSYEQGLHLLEAGAIGGIVTFDEIENATAVTAGSTIARLLNYGLPLYGALHILQKRGDVDHQYHIVGDGRLTVIQTSQGSPVAGSITPSEDGNDVIVNSYVTSSKKMGSVYRLNINTIDLYRLASGKIYLRSESTAELVEFLNTEPFPILLDGKLRWSTDIKTSEL